jgi:hypothetical protein
MNKPDKPESNVDARPAWAAAIPFTESQRERCHQEQILRSLKASTNMETIVALTQGASLNEFLFAHPNGGEARPGKAFSIHIPTENPETIPTKTPRVEAGSLVQ